MPSAIAAPVVAQLREHGRIERDWIGVAMTGLGDEKRPPGTAPRQGVRVEDVQPGSPAARAGLRRGDIITAYRGTPVTNPRQLAWAVAQTPVRERVEVTLERNGRELTRSRTVDARPARNAARRAVPGG